MQDIGRMEKPKILVVEDEAPIQELLRFNLERKKYRVKVVDSGEAALEVVGQYMPDLILLDIMLPGIDGYEVCEILRLKPAWRNIRVVFLTAKGSEEDIARGLVLGADAYVVKPFTNKNVVDTVNKLLQA